MFNRSTFAIVGPAIVVGSVELRFLHGIPLILRFAVMVGSGILFGYVVRECVSPDERE